MIKQYSLSMTIDNQKRKLICRALTKALLILHELIPQIPLFWNYENHIYAYLKSREAKDYLKIKENLPKCFPKGKCSKFIKNEFFLPKTLIKDEKL